MNSDRFLYISSFNWEMDAIELFQHQLPEITETIDKIFEYIFKQEYRFCDESHEDIDTVEIREIIFNYILRIFGID